MQRNLKASVCWALVIPDLTTYLCADCKGACGSSSMFQNVKHAFQCDMFQMAALMKQYFPISLPELKHWYASWCKELSLGIMIRSLGQQSWLCPCSSCCILVGGCSVKVSPFQWVLHSEAPFLVASLMSGNKWEFAVACLQCRVYLRAVWDNYQRNEVVDVLFL